MTGQPLISVTDLLQTFHTPAGTVYAVNGVTFSIAPGESVGLVGESGSGKSTVAKCLVRLQEPHGGTIAFNGQDITHLSERAFRRLRSRIQMVFQDPTMSLNPRLTVRQTLGEPLKIHGLAASANLEEKLEHLVDLVHLDRKFLGRRPHELSGGQRQRVGIARAIATSPDFVVLDEPTSSLDMSIRIQIIALLQRLQRELGVAYLFISHDLSTVRYLCSRVLVMYRGRIVEEGPVEAIFTNPQHDYTRALLSAAPVPDPARRHHRQRIVIPPDLSAPASPAAFRMVEVGPDGHRVARLS